MENEITIIDGQEYLNGQEAIGSKRIKMDEIKYDAIKKRRYVKKEEPAFEEAPVVETSEEPIVEDDTKVEFPEFEEKEIVNEEVELPKEPMEFAFRTSDKAYHAIEVGDEISEAQEEQIRGLGSAYKGTNPNSELRKVMEEAPKKKEKKVTEEEFLSALETESYSDKTREYKETTKEEYNNLISKLNAKNEEIEYVMKMYQNATEIGKNLQETIHKAQKTLNSINELDLGFINEIKGEKSIAVLKALEDLFNENKKVVLDSNDKLNNNDIEKQGIGEEEQRLKRELTELKKKLELFIEEKYEKLVELNTIDEKFKEYDDNLTTITGITGKSVDGEQEISTVSSISNLQDMPSMNMSNHFDSLREQPQTVVGVNSYGPSQNYNDMTFGGRVM